MFRLPVVFLFGVITGVAASVSYLRASSRRSEELREWERKLP